MGLIRITSAESDAEKDIADIPALFPHRIYCYEKEWRRHNDPLRYHAGIQGLPLKCFLEIFEIYIFSLIRESNFSLDAHHASILRKIIIYERSLPRTD